MDTEIKNILKTMRDKACGLEEIFIGCESIPCDDDIKYAIDACEFILNGINHLSRDGKS